MGWITRLVEGADKQRSTTQLAREEARAEDEPQMGGASLGFWPPDPHEIAELQDREIGE